MRGRASGTDFKPFVYEDLKKFLPPCFNEHVVVLLDDESHAGGQSTKGAWGKKDYRLNFASWLVAWDRCSLLYWCRALLTCIFLPDMLLPLRALSNYISLMR